MSKRGDPFAALGDATRREIVRLLGLPADSAGQSASLTAGQIASHFPSISRAAVSKHLGVLRSAGLVRARESGRERHYSVSRSRMQDLRAELESLAPVWQQSLQRLKETAEGDDR